MSAHRARRREQADEAYELQARAGALGAVRYGTLGVGLAAVSHYTWPWFRRQTLPFKGFLVTLFTVYGLVTAADTALLSHEHQQRIAEADMRREARLDLARRGMVATESEIIKWRTERERAQAQANANANAHAQQQQQQQQES